MPFTRDPREWGPTFWSTMHTVAAFYPDHPTSEDMSNARNFFLSLVGLLPCHACAQHYAEMLARHPIENALLSKMELVKWCWTLHDEVNQRNGKVGPSFSEYVESIDSNESADNRVGFILIGVIVGVLIILLVRALVQRHEASAMASRLH